MDVKNKFLRPGFFLLKYCNKVKLVLRLFLVGSVIIIPTFQNVWSSSLFNSIYQTTPDSLNENQDPFDFIKSESAFLSKPNVANGTSLLGVKTGSIASMYLRLGSRYRLNEMWELGGILTLSNYPDQSRISEIELIAKYQLPFHILASKEYFAYTKFRNSFGNPYIKSYSGKFENIQSEVSQHSDGGTDLSIGVLSKNKLEIKSNDFSLTGGIEYSYLGRRDYFDFNQKFNHRIVLMLNLEKEISNNLILGLENRYNYWMNRGDYLEIIPQIIYKIKPNINFQAGISIPIIGNSVHFIGGVRLALFEPEKKIGPELPKYIPPPQIPPITPTLKREINLSDYNIPFFVTGYYRVNTKENLEELIWLQSQSLKKALYIEKILKGTKLYNNYMRMATQIDSVLNDLFTKLIQDIFPNFVSYYDSTDIIEISIYGYADPRRLSGKYYEDLTIEYFNSENKLFKIMKDDDLDNFKLAGLRSYHTGKLLDEIFFNNSKDYRTLKEQNRIRYKVYSMGVAGDVADFAAQRRIKIIFDIKSK